MTRLLSAVVNLFIGLTEAILALRIVFRLFGANSTQFVSWTYNTSDQLLEPFRGIFTPSKISGGHVLDFSALFGLLIYALIGAILISVLRALRHDKVKVKDKSSK
jgi:uncharacterized protein YggT (Ycf19 family)